MMDFRPLLKLFINRSAYQIDGTVQIIPVGIKLLASDARATLSFGWCGRDIEFEFLTGYLFLILMVFLLMIGLS